MWSSPSRCRRARCGSRPTRRCRHRQGLPAQRNARGGGTDGRQVLRCGGCDDRPGPFQVGAGTRLRRHGRRWRNHCHYQSAARRGGRVCAGTTWASTTSAKDACFWSTVRSQRSDPVPPVQPCVDSKPKSGTTTQVPGCRMERLGFGIGRSITLQEGMTTRMKIAMRLAMILAMVVATVGVGTGAGTAQREHRSR